jgi:hypothetical protein
LVTIRLNNPDKVKNPGIKNRILAIKTFRFDFFNRMVVLFPATVEISVHRIVSLCYSGALTP